MEKHIEDGKRAKLRFGSRGEFFITISILNEKENLSEKVEFLVDTGFNGFLQLSSPIVNKLKLDIIKKDKTRGFDGIEVIVDITKAKVELLNGCMSDCLIQVVPKGLSLIGTRLLNALGVMLIIDYKNLRASLTGNKKVQKKVHKAVDKYS